MRPMDRPAPPAPSVLAPGYGFGGLFVAAAVLLAVAARQHPGASPLLLWAAASFAVVAAAYLMRRPGWLGKRPDGTRSPVATLLLAPYLAYTTIAWHAMRLLSHERPIDAITPTLSVSRRLLGRERPQGVDRVVDLTCEFVEPAALRGPGYVHHPILDGFTVAVEDLHRWAGQAAGRPGVTLVHCAQGHGRTGLFAAAVLLVDGTVRTADEAVALLRRRRPGIRLRRRQLATLRQLEQRLAYSVPDRPGGSTQREPASAASSQGPR